MKKISWIIIGFFSLAAIGCRTKIPLVFSNSFSGKLLRVEVNKEVVFNDSLFTDFVLGIAQVVKITDFKSGEIKLFVNGNEILFFKADRFLRNKGICFDIFFHETNSSFYYINIELINKKKLIFF